MLTYNHGGYLKNAIESVLAQKTNFSYKLIICNDNSHDNSHEIIKHYAEQYPDVIEYYKHDKNIGFVENQRFSFSKAEGDYIAYCEGDDYWTDEYKLQFQFDFLEENKDFVMCTARNLLLHQNSGEITSDFKDQLFLNREFIDYNQETFFIERPTQTFTYLIRKNSLDLKWIDVYPNYRDLYYFYHVLEFGKGRAFNKVFGVYRLHDGGVFSALNIEEKIKTSIEIFKNIKSVNNDNRANLQILRDYDNLINKYYYIKDFPLPLLNIKLYKNIALRFMVSYDLKTLGIQLGKTLKNSFK